MNLKYADPKILKQIDQIIFESKLPVEGNISGKHKSNLIGKSLEFVQHREYFQGDDLKTIDWKVYARREKFYIKQYHQETNLNCYFLLDCSESMFFRYKNELTKYEYANNMISYISYILLSQNDNVGLIKYDNKIQQIIFPRYGKEYYYKILNTLDEINFNQKTDWSNLAENILKYIKKNSLLILISDLIFEQKKVVNILKQLNFSEINVLVLHIIEPVEKSLELGSERILFEDLENKNLKIESNIEDIKELYQKEFIKRIEFFKKEFSNSKIKYYEIYTDVKIIENLKLVLNE